ncbi:ankyrin repeat domain-containing protein (plasmid) [Novosphingobium sp. BL-8A]|uniref:ankyrin repeat domain-containing protein n=1 Tax=Novosphingobium sp. BL-8A TaxID=3127639 RepID=UPI0037578FB6
MRNETQELAAGESRLPPLPPPERLQELLFETARLGRTDLILALVQAGARVDAYNGKGHTSLILATYHGHHETAEALLESGAAVDQTDCFRGNTALMGATFKGHLGTAEMLLERGAQPDVPNFAGQTALMMASLFGREDFVDLLISHGADIELSDVAGNDALSVAYQQGNAVMAHKLARLSTRGTRNA